MFIGEIGEHVMQPLESQRSQVTVGIECVEMGADGGRLPDALARYADSAVGGGSGDRENVEPVAIGGERFVVEEGF